jgi:large subunit ribosomal protein L21
VKIGENMKYVVVESGGKQYNAVEGGLISVDRLQQEVGDLITLDQVLLVVDEENVMVGTPVVKGASVKVKVVEHYKGRKILVFHYKSRENYRKKSGHRQQYTRLQVESILVE